jgi:hypothetical protein
MMKLTPNYEFPFSGDYRPLALVIRRARQTIATTPALKREARAWVSDNDVPMGGWNFDDVLDFIAAYYSGGLPEFYLNTRYILPTTTRNFK